MSRRVSPRVWAVVVATQVVSAILAWRDLGRRDDDQIRGRRRLWRVAMIANPGNSGVYWLVGRRR